MFKRAQNSLEFLLIFVFVFGIFAIALFVLGVLTQDLTISKNNEEVDDFAKSIISEFDLLQNVESGYRREIVVPYYLMDRFNLTIEDNLLIVQDLEFYSDNSEKFYYELPGNYVSKTCSYEDGMHIIVQNAQTCDYDGLQLQNYICVQEEITCNLFNFKIVNSDLCSDGYTRYSGLIYGIFYGHAATDMSYDWSLCGKSYDSNIVLNNDCSGTYKTLFYLANTTESHIFKDNSNSYLLESQANWQQICLGVTGLDEIYVRYSSSDLSSEGYACVVSYYGDPIFGGASIGPCALGGDRIWVGTEPYNQEYLNCPEGTLDNYHYPEMTHGDSQEVLKTILIDNGLQDFSAIATCNDGIITLDNEISGVISCDSGYYNNGTSCELSSCSAGEYIGESGLTYPYNSLDNGQIYLAINSSSISNGTTFYNISLQCNLGILLNISSEQFVNTTCNEGHFFYDGSCKDSIFVIISSDIENYNLYEDLGRINDSVKVNILIDSGVIIGSTSTLIPSFTTGDMAIESEIFIINRGRIQGKGGKGGAGAPNDATTWGEKGENGGTALELLIPITINNSQGEIFGGGGGGGGGGSCHSHYESCWWAEGGGGGGGAGTDIGIGGIGPGSYNGGPGTSEFGGIGVGGRGDYSQCVGGNGGNPGADGTDAWTSYLSPEACYRQGLGGSAGNAIKLNGHSLSWEGNNGEIKGIIS